ncbi:MAG: hypothetical protein P1U40_06780 [Coxiellaceae bacterium]|nr:hypothetical protein [Coxiellaceae bacterium]
MSRTEESKNTLADLLPSNTIATSLLRHIKLTYDINESTLKTLGFTDDLQRYTVMISPEAPTKKSVKAWADKWCTIHRAELADFTLITPERTIYSSDKRIRRMDSLAKLLAPKEAITPCIAIACTKAGLIVSANRTRKPTEHNRRSIHEIIATKLTILRALFAAYESADTKHAKEKLLKDAAFDLLTAGGICSLTVEDKSKRRNPLFKQIDNLVSILRKVVNGVLSESEDETSYSNETKRILLTTADLPFIYPNTDFEEDIGGTVHAEQALMKLIESQMLHSQPREPIIFGITKLACTDCDRALQTKPYIVYRGNHGMSFPRVVDTVATKISPDDTIGSRVSLRGEQLPDDSDSDKSSDVDDTEYASTALSSSDGLIKPPQPRLPLKIKAAIFHMYRSPSVATATPITEEGTPDITSPRL